ncbi:MAG: hypothetical protein RMY34_14990 [Aulosira sp. DedQUE10]|nr:hypothetical protein [Aulosira sp. DedQUE10]
MSIAELFPTLRNLSRAEKLQIMQFLVQELADEEALSLQPETTYLKWHLNCVQSYKLRIFNL